MDRKKSIENDLSKRLRKTFAREKRHIDNIERLRQSRQTYSKKRHDILKTRRQLSDEEESNDADVTQEGKETNEENEEMNEPPQHVPPSPSLPPPVEDQNSEPDSPHSPTEGAEPEDEDDGAENFAFGEGKSFLLLRSFCTLV